MATQDQLIQSVLNKLRSALGTSEHPPGSNHNFITEWYNAHVDKIGNGAWCEMTQTWAMWECGLKPIKKGRAYTVWGAEDGQNHVGGATWHWGVAGMRAGDQVYYDWSGRKGTVSGIDHTGRVEKINGNGTFYALEGNANDVLKRTLRDSQFVVGYVRPDWHAMATNPPAPVPAPKPATKPVHDVHLVTAVQRALELVPTGKWDHNTDIWAVRMRTALRAHAGYPHNKVQPFNVKAVQGVIDVVQDGDWGPKSQAALVKWAHEYQKAIGVTADGQWGPGSDNKFLAVRRNNLNNF